MQGQDRASRDLTRLSQVDTPAADPLPRHGATGNRTVKRRQSDNFYTFMKFKTDVMIRRRRHPTGTRHRPAGSGRRPFSGVSMDGADDGGFGAAVYSDDNDFTRSGGVSGKCQNIDVVGHQDYCPGRFLVF